MGNVCEGSEVGEKGRRIVRLQGGKGGRVVVVVVVGLIHWWETQGESKILSFCL